VGAGIWSSNRCTRAAIKAHGVSKCVRLLFTLQARAVLIESMDNNVSIRPHTMGVRLTEQGEVYCTICRSNDAWVQVNLDGIYTYLCTLCWSSLADFVANPAFVVMSPPLCTLVSGKCLRVTLSHWSGTWRGSIQTSAAGVTMSICLRAACTASRWVRVGSE
jgi:hypothetical protein